MNQQSNTAGESTVDEQPRPSAIIAKQLARVRRRLFAQRAVAALPWVATIAFAAAAIVVAVDKYYPLEITWPLTLYAAAGATLVVTLAAAAVANRSELAAALELDKRCKLDERVSTALAFRAATDGKPRELAPSQVAVRRAVEADAEQAVAKVDVRSAFPIVASRRLAWPLVPTCAAIAVALWLAPHVPPTAPAAAAVQQAQVQMKETAKTLEKKLAEKKAEAEKLQLVEAQKLLEKLQEEARRIKAADKVDRKESLVKLNEVAKQIQERREQVSGADEMKKQLSRLRAKNPGTSEKLTRALSEGKFGEAAEQIEQLKKELESGKLDPEQKKKIADQLQNLQKQVEQMAKAQEERRKEAEKQLADKKNQPGNSKDGSSKDGKPDGKQSSGDQAGQKNGSQKDGSQGGAGDESKLAEQLSKLASQQQSLDSLQKALDQASQGMQNGKGSDAAQGLQDLQKQLDQLSQQANESDLLDRGLQDLADSKAQFGEGQAGDQQPGGGEQSNSLAGSGQQSDSEGGGGENGDGKNGNGQGLGAQGQGNAGGKGNQPGSGIGRGVGNNFDGGDSKLTGTFDTRVKQQVGEGAFRVIGPTDGPNAKGKALEAIRDQEQAVATGREAQTLESQALDRSRREQKKQYFEALRKAD